MIFIDKYRKSLTFKLVINIFMIHALFVTIFIYDIVTRESSFMMKQLSSKGEDLTTILSSNASTPMLNSDFVALNELISDMNSIDEHYMVFLFDKNMRVRASNPTKYFNHILTDDISLELFRELNSTNIDTIQKNHNNLIDTISKIYVNNKVIGYSRVILSSTTLSNELNELIFNSILYVIIVLLSGSLLALGVLRKVTANLKKLTFAANEISNRNFDIKIPKINSKDEIANMVNAFEVMQNSLQNYIKTLNRSQQRLTLALEGSSDGLWDLNLATDKVYFSPRWKSMLGYSNSELDNDFDTWIKNIHPDDVNRANKVFEEFMNSSRLNYENRFRMRHKDGYYIPILSRAKKVYTNNSLTRLVGTHTDISDLVKAQEFLQEVIDGVNLPILVVSKEHKVLFKNISAKNLEILSNNKKILLSTNNLNIIDNAILNNKKIKTTENYIDINNQRHTLELIIQPIKDKDNKIDSVIKTAYDISSLIDAQNFVEYQADHDALTGLVNRRLLFKTINQNIHSLDKRDKKMALLFLDLDNFKEINDSAGHNVGDLLLKKVSNILKELLRDIDILSRLGGDEFVILLNDIDSEQIVLDMINRIMQGVDIPHNIDGQSFYTTFSIGVSIYPKDGITSNTLLKNADIAMYKAKDRGKNTYAFYTDDMSQKVLDKIELESKLRDAIRNDELDVYYQPQVDIRRDEIIGLEALVRWITPTEIVSPAIFIPLAEENGMISQIDKIVMKKALKDFKKWKKYNKTLRKISVNLSVLELSNIDFIDDLNRTILESGCDATWVELEVTESQIMSDPQKAISKLRDINSMGIKLSIDDFGTGYSSLSYLRELPIDKLKIDKSFIDEIENNSDAQEIVRTIIAMSNSLNLNLIAEGVETQKQKDFLLNNGCFEIQGYFYYKPMSRDEIEKILI